MSSCAEPTERQCEQHSKQAVAAITCGVGVVGGVGVGAVLRVQSDDTAPDICACKARGVAFSSPEQRAIEKEMGLPFSGLHRIA